MALASGDAEHRQRVGRVCRNDDPGDRGRDQARQERRQDQGEGERPKQDLEREQCAAQRHVVDGRHAGARARGDEQAPIALGERARALTELARERRTGQLRRSLAAERGAHADGHDRDDPAHEAWDQLEASAVKPKCFRHLAAARALRAPNDQCARAGKRAGRDQHEHDMDGRGRRDGGQELARGATPGDAFDEVEECDEAGAGETGRHADRDDATPEAGAVAGQDALSRDVRLRRGEASRHQPVRGVLRQLDAGRVGCRTPGSLASDSWERERRPRVEIKLPVGRAGFVREGCPELP